MAEEPQQNEFPRGVSIANGILKTEVGAWKLNLISSVRLVVVKERVFLALLIATLFLFVCGTSNPNLMSGLPIILWALIFFGILGSGYTSVIINTAGVESAIWRKNMAWFQFRKIEAEGTTIVNGITSAIGGIEM